MMSMTSGKKLIFSFIDVFPPTKAISLTTTAEGYRLMINSISYVF